MMIYQLKLDTKILTTNIEASKDTPKLTKNNTNRSAIQNYPLISIINHFRHIFWVIEKGYY